MKGGNIEMKNKKWCSQCQDEIKEGEGLDGSNCCSIECFNKQREEQKNC